MERFKSVGRWMLVLSFPGAPMAALVCFGLFFSMSGQHYDTAEQARQATSTSHFYAFACAGFLIYSIVAWRILLRLNKKAAVAVCQRKPEEPESSLGPDLCRLDRDMRAQITELARILNGGFLVLEFDEYELLIRTELERIELQKPLRAKARQKRVHGS